MCVFFLLSDTQKPIKVNPAASGPIAQTRFFHRVTPFFFPFQLPDRTSNDPPTTFLRCSAWIWRPDPERRSRKNSSSATPTPATVHSTTTITTTTTTTTGKSNFIAFFGFFFFHSSPPSIRPCVVIFQVVV